MRQRLEYLYPEHGVDLLLTIYSIHAEKIFSGGKNYELRKSLPKKIPSTIFLYESGGKAITGFFTVKYIVSGDPRDVWREVGNGATSRDRFKNYYHNYGKAVAIKVGKSVKFNKPIPLKELARIDETIKVPQVFTYLNNHEDIHNKLKEFQFGAAINRSYNGVRMFTISESDHKEFFDLVEEHVSDSYLETGSTYAKYLIQQNETGYDPEGVFTYAKSIFSIFYEKTKIGYIVLTEKRGGSVKTGPFVVFQRHRGKGYGKKVREALHDFLECLGHRKVYATIPIVKKEALHYLLSSGYRIEGHLGKHYHEGHDELVLGYCLDLPSFSYQQFERSHIPAKKNWRLRSEDLRVGLFVSKIFPQAYFTVPDGWVTDQVKYAARTARGREEGFKKREIFVAEREGEVKAVILCVIKRGGSAKLILLSETGHAESLNMLIDRAEKSIRSSYEMVRKIYTHIPVEDNQLYGVFKKAGYESEGVVRRPYNSFTDMLILAK